MSSSRKLNETLFLYLIKVIDCNYKNQNHLFNIGCKWNLLNEKFAIVFYGLFQYFGVHNITEQRYQNHTTEIISHL